jgi:hypothetical protein
MKLGVGILGVSCAVCALLIIGLFLSRVVWAWVIPDLFPGAVRTGQIVASLTWLQAFKLSLLGCILWGSTRSSKN